MKVLTGVAKKGFGIAGDNLHHCQGLIARRLGLPKVLRGTLNVVLPEPYQVKPDAALSALKYNGLEVILLQRCVVRGQAAAIMRPHTHEIRPPNGKPHFGHGFVQVELMAPFSFRDDLGIALGDEVDIEVEGDDAWWASALRAT